MEGKKLYKDTEVGRIPVDWEVARIEELATITTGSRNTQNKVDGGKYPFFVRSSKVERINSYSYDGEAVLTAGDGVGTGKVFHYINGKFDFHQRVYKISDFSERLDGFYFYLYFSNNFLKRIMSMTAKSSVDSVRMEMISKMPIPLPPLKEQKTIAKVLADIDELITSIEKLIHKKKLIKQGAMQELLSGKKRLPGFSGEWQVRKLGEIAEFYSGGTPLTSNKKYYGGTIPWITSGDLNKRQIREVSGRITELGLRNSAAKMVKKGTVLIALYGATAGVVAISEIDAAINQAILAIILKNDDSKYLYYRLSYMKEWITKTFTQGGQPNLSANIIKSIPIPLPPLKEQKAIAQILSDMDSEIESLEKKLEKYKLTKEAMMEKLLTGQVRLV